MTRRNVFFFCPPSDSTTSWLRRHVHLSLLLTICSHDQVAPLCVLPMIAWRTSGQLARALDKTTPPVPPWQTCPMAQKKPKEMLCLWLRRRLKGSLFVNTSRLMWQEFNFLSRHMLQSLTISLLSFGHFFLSMHLTICRGQIHEEADENHPTKAWLSNYGSDTKTYDQQSVD